jgi:predicted phage terminase large subunit-like protein
MYSAAYLAQRRQADPHLFEANYQQRPGEGSGDVFKREWFDYYDTLPDGYRLQSWDTAVKTGQENDYSAFVEAIVTPNRDVYVTDVHWERLEFPQLVAKVKEYARRAPRTVLVEDKSSGSSAIQVLRQQSGVPIVAIKPETDKVSRARSTTGWFESGKVFFPRNHPKVAEFEAFLTGFPMLAHDDPVDALTQLLGHVITTKSTIPSQPMKPPGF